MPEDKTVDHQKIDEYNRRIQNGETLTEDEKKEHNDLLEANNESVRGDKSADEQDARSDEDADDRKDTNA